MESQLKQNNSVNFAFLVHEKFFRMRNLISILSQYGVVKKKKKHFDLKMSKCLQNQSEVKF